MAAPGSVLRVLTCGSVDDGKSTLIGRLLFEFGALPDDVVAALVRDSRRFGTVGERVDYALLVDGLAAEREQGVTIDVAYRFFETPGGEAPGRRFILADTPGHEQYTCNMVTGASTADVAVLLVDASRGVLAQTRRHLAVVWLMGIRQVVLAVNKMDLVKFAPEAFHATCREFAALLPALPGVAVTAIPICARDGDNVVEPGERMGWHAGPTVLGALVAAPAGSMEAGGAQPFRMPVQLVVRPDASFRGYAGTVAAGVVRPGDVVCNAASGVSAGVRAIVTMDGERAAAGAGDAVTLVLDREIDVSRGDVLAQGPAPPCADEVTAWLVWMAETPLLRGRAYSVRLGTATVTGTITAVLGRLEMDGLQERAAEQLGRNEIGRVVISLTQRLVCEAYAMSRTLGGFILVDRISGSTLGAGMVLEARSRPVNVHWHRLDVDKAGRAGLKGQLPCILWFTGLSASGKSTIANLVERRLVAMGRHSMVLDGDNVRHGLNRDLGFSEKDRVENIRRVAETAKLFVEAGLIVLVSFISPYRQERGMARDLVAAGEFLEVFVDTPIAECRRRDPKGLYAKADAGEVRNFTGVDAPYEPPLAPELVLSTVEHPAEALAEQVVAELVRRGIVV